MIAGKNFYDICFRFFYPTASATAYGQRPKFFRAEHSATAEGENCAYCPTLGNCNINHMGLGCLQPVTYSIELEEKDSRIVCYLKIGFLPKQTRFILS